MTKTKSPIKDKPLRYAAQSLDEALDDLLIDKVLIFYLAGCMCLIAAIYEWWRYYRPLNHPPVTITVVLLGMAMFCVVKIVIHIKKMKNYRQGRDGERAVGQYLETFREMGCHVFHDILGENFNVDHVVISDKGIYVIETKTYSKPAKGETVIDFDGRRVLINGRESKADIVTQAKAASSYVRKIINDSTGKNYKVFPVVLFPGWFVDGVGNKKGEMWVLEPRGFKMFLSNEKVKLSDDDVALTSYHLSRHIRAS